ncbi:unnamed protein product [Paramecium sonneborni]|uniref:Peptidase A1 domain-containing protein n=1 Tax=Paramecium sonneborni TaxID=65129 RepID=A0A8S1RP67_9CILI|nr:unnamed protein product [Paramecium sonneborni]
MIQGRISIVSLLKIINAILHLIRGIGGFYYKVQVLIRDGLIQLDDLYTGQFQTQLADGIFGLGPTQNYSQYPPNLIDFIAKKDKALQFKRRFSICLNYDYGIQVQDPDFKINKIKYSPNQQYQINLINIAFGDQIFTIYDSIHTQGQGTFIDSRATISYMDHKIYHKLVQAIKIVSIQIKLRLNITFYPNFYFKIFHTLIIIHISFNKIKIFWKPQDYLFIQNQQVFLGVEKYQDRTILGQNWTRKKDFLFDLDQQEISIVSANCTLDQFKLQVINTFDSDDQTLKQNIQIAKFTKKNIEEEQNVNQEQDTENVEKDNINIPAQVNEDDEHSWLEILNQITKFIQMMKDQIKSDVYPGSQPALMNCQIRQSQKRFLERLKKIKIFDKIEQKRDLELNLDLSMNSQKNQLIRVSQIYGLRSKRIQSPFPIDKQAQQGGVEEQIPQELKKDTLLSLGEIREDQEDEDQADKNELERMKQYLRQQREEKSINPLLFLAQQICDIIAANN